MSTDISVQAICQVIMIALMIKVILTLDLATWNLYNIARALKELTNVAKENKNEEKLTQEKNAKST